MCVTDGCLQHRLLAELELTLKDAVKIAIAQETAEKEVQQLQQQKRPQSSVLHNISQTNKHISQTNKQSHRPPVKKPCATNAVVITMNHVLPMR